MDDYQEILNTLNVPLILSKPISNLHKIFTKYTSHPYYQYSFNLLETLCNHTNYDNKKRLLHMAFTYLTAILYNCGNIPYLSNFDIMILACFNLSIKTIENQKVVPCLNKLKKIYKEKFINYQKEEIVKVELICIKLLNYKINLLTTYDCLYYLLSIKQNNKNNNKGKDFLEIATKELEKQLINNIKENINKKPLDFAKEIIENLNKKRNKINYPKLLKRKIVPMLHQININKSKIEKKNNEKYDNNNSYSNAQMSNYMSNFSNSKNSPIYSHQSKYSDKLSHRSKLKSNIYNKPISLVLPYTENNYSSNEKKKVKRDITQKLLLSSSTLINSFGNLDVELNNSPFNKTNCESSSQNGSDGISSFIIHNNSGINLTKNSSFGNVFKKPCLKKKYIKTFFTMDKKKDSINNNKSEVNLTQENIFGDDAPQKSSMKKIKNKFFSNTSFCWGETNRITRSKNRIIKLH